MKLLNGKPIVDADKPLKINVMRKDIQKADPCDPCNCAVAQSLKRIPNVMNVRVGSTVVLVEKPRKVFRYKLSAEETRRIRAFDNAGYFQPGSYELKPPSRKLGGRKDGSGSNVREGKAKTVYNATPINPEKGKRHALRPPKKDES